MAEVQRYESMVPMRFVVLQGKGHGPVLVRSPGLTTATCLQCEWHGFDRGALPSSDGLIEADGELHLQDVEDAQVSQCPACGRKGLFIGDGGYLTCSQGDCPQPDVFAYWDDLRAKAGERIEAEVRERITQEAEKVDAQWGPTGSHPEVIRWRREMFAAIAREEKP